MADDDAPNVSGAEGTAQVVTPPPGAANVDKEPSRPRPTRVRVKPLEARLHEFFGKVEQTREGGVYYGGLAGMVGVFDPIDGQIIALHSENMAKAWANLAAGNERVKRYLEWMLSGGAWGEVFVATSPVIFAIAMNHGMMPKSFFGPIVVEEDGAPDAEESGGDSGSQRSPVEPVPPGV